MLQTTNKLINRRVYIDKLRWYNACNIRIHKRIIYHFLFL